MHYANLRGALIQVLNYHVSHATIDSLLSRSLIATSPETCPPLQLSTFRRIYHLIRTITLDADGNELCLSLPTTPAATGALPPNLPQPDLRAQTGPARLQKGGLQSPMRWSLDGGKGAYHKFKEESESSAVSAKRKLLRTAPGKQENAPLDFDKMAEEELERTTAALAQGAGFAAVRSKGR